MSIYCNYRATVQKVVAAIGTQISRTIALKQWDQTAVIMARSVQWYVFIDKTA